LAKKIPSIIKEIQKFKNLEINYQFNKSISYSQFQIYQSCPLKWSLLYKQGIKVSTSNIHTVFGSALHKILQLYLDNAYNKSIVMANSENLSELFEEYLREEYLKEYKKSNNHISSPEELREFFENGIELLQYFTKNFNKYFSKRSWHLVGCEIPLIITPNKRYTNVIYKGYMDVVLYHEPTQTFKIIDLKTSNHGWNTKTKNDEDKQFQLILYKHFFSEQFGIPLDKIEIEFIIFKRNPYENPDYPTKKIQNFSPPSGKIKIKKALESLNSFIEEVFTIEGEYKDKEYKQKISPLCHFCPFNINPDLCKK